MKSVLSFLFLFGSAQMVMSIRGLFNIPAIYETGYKFISLGIKHGFNGYNPFLTSDQVLNIACAKPSDKVFNPVYFNDTDMSTKLDLTKPIGFVIHGWLDNGYSIWMNKFTKTWIDNNDMNVCRVDWSVYSYVEYSVAARRNVKLVGYHLSKFIKALNTLYNVALSDVTLMGHSLGGQICGTTGFYLGGKVGRIIAMDPAGPLFTFPFNVPLEDQLDKSDAQFVTVVHSNGYVLGVGYSIGHADFYGNGKLPIQPGCVFPLLFGIYAVEYTPIICSHFRSFKFVHLALDNNPRCTAVKCNKFSDYLAKRCTNETDTWGLNSAKKTGDFYFWSGRNPKCSGKYWPVV